MSVARRNLKDLRQTSRPQPRLPKPGEPVGTNLETRLRPNRRKGCSEKTGRDQSWVRAAWSDREQHDPGDLIASCAGGVRSRPGR